MELEAKVNYGLGCACYQIRREAPGIYFADLVFYDGERSKQPPSAISLVRGVRQWTGSCDDDGLLNELGRIIEEHLSESREEGTNVHLRR
jgi:hypothetical protein